MIKFSIPTIINRLSKLEDVIIMHDSLFMETITLAGVDTLADVILDTLYKRKILFDDTASITVIKRMLHTYVGDTLDRDKLRTVARLIVSAYDEIKKGEYYPIWAPNGEKGWGLFYVSDAIRSEYDKNKFNCIIECKAGNPVNHIIEKALSGSYMIHIIKQCGGNRYEKYSPVNLGGMFFAASLNFTKSNFKFDDFYKTSSIDNHNKRLLKERQKPCAKNMTKTCDMCYMGMDMCVRSPHMLTYRPGICANGHKGYIASPGGYCMSCLRKGKVKK